MRYERAGYRSTNSTEKDPLVSEDHAGRASPSRLQGAHTPAPVWRRGGVDFCLRVKRMSADVNSPPRWRWGAYRMPRQPDRVATFWSRSRTTGPRAGRRDRQFMRGDAGRPRDIVQGECQMNIIGLFHEPH